MKNKTTLLRNLALLATVCSGFPALAQNSPSEKDLRERVDMLEKKLSELQKGLAPTPSAAAPPATAADEKTPFNFADFTWLNGNSRESSSPLNTKYVTPEFIVDTNPGSCRISCDPRTGSTPRSSYGCR